MKQKLILGGGASAGSSGIVSVTLTATDWTSAASTSNQYNWGAQSIGAAPTGSDRRFLVIMDFAGDGSGGVVKLNTSVNGVDATLEGYARSGSTSSRISAISTYELSTGTTATFISKYDQTVSYGGIGIYSVITGPSGLISLDSEAVTNTSTNIIHAGGAGYTDKLMMVGISVINGSMGGITLSGVSNCTFTSADFEEDMNTNEWMTGWSDATAGNDPEADWGGGSAAFSVLYGAN